MTTSINSILENNGNKDDLIALFFDKNLPVDDIEDDLVYTLLKSSDIVNDVTTARKKVIITQNFVNQDTEYIKYCYPKTWKYLIDHIDYFLKRKSSVYKNKPLFSIFSIGEYSFLPYKIAISSLYKKICFQLIMPDDNKPVMVDDTCNYISFETETEARFVYSLLISKTVEVYLDSIIFWDNKRPITTQILKTIELSKVAKKENIYNDFVVFTSTKVKQLSLFGY